MKGSKKTFEIRLAARTRELQKLAENLESQDKRTVELQGEIEKFEKINKLMVERDLKMIEMKEKIDHTSKKLKRNIQ